MLPVFTYLEVEKIPDRETEIVTNFLNTQNIVILGILRLILQHLYLQFWNSTLLPKSVVESKLTQER